MNRATQKKFAHLPAIKGGVVTSVRVGAETTYKYRIPARVLERQRKVLLKHKPKKDEDDIGQGEGCEGGKCKVPRGR